MGDESALSMDSVRMYMLEIGGICTNHDLVAKFKPFLNHPVKKLENRNKLKEFVQLLASVENRNGERVLVLKKRYSEQGCFNLLPNQLYSKEYDDSGRQPISQLTIPENFIAEEPSEDSVEPLPVAVPAPPQQKYTPQGSLRGESLDQTDYPAAPPVMPPPGRSSVIPSVGAAPLERTFVPLPERVSVPPPERVSAPPPDKTSVPPWERSAAVPLPERTSVSLPERPPVHPIEGSSLLPAGRPASPADASSLPNTSNANSAGNSTAPHVTFYSTPEKSNDAHQQSPMSAKERIKQFDQMHVSEEKQEVISHYNSYRRNKENRSHSHSTVPGSEFLEYDGSVAMVSLEPIEKEWMVTSSGSDYLDMCKLLNSHPELAHRRDFINGNAMHWAAKHGRPEVIKLLNGYKVDADLRSFCGHTPLHLAAMNGNEECIDLLVNLCKAKPNTRDFYGKRPKQYLQKMCSTRIQQMLLNTSRQGFPANNTTEAITTDDMNAFARTQSFSAKIMKNNQGLARNMSVAARSCSDDFRELEGAVGSQSRQTAPGADAHYHSVNPLPALHHLDVDNSSMSRSESAPDIYPKSDRSRNSPYSNIQ